nr:PREDICTED: FGGY carbohydrate kinase domain-containing protein [Bemisia tabaci]XP_018902388.1 PREDICTED: FGGY carbohydrate kinase domain-containing protein [Bemisia tabaci]
MGSSDYVIGVDVGTGSVRAALVSAAGTMVKSAVKEIKTWNPKPNFHQQSSEDIWNAVCATVKEVCNGIEKTAVKGIGFDATCSLVVLDKKLQPLSVSPNGEQTQNVILWMDHRAEKEAEFINKLNHPVLKYTGGKISLEMETPKLLWLKRNLFDTCWKKAGHFFDLPDFLTWRATGAFSRSLCSLVCKWTYVAYPDGDCNEDSYGWNLDYFQQLGLEDLSENNWGKIGSIVKSPGDPCGHGLDKKAALELGLAEGTAVGASIIDAHAGGLGLIGLQSDIVPPSFETRIGLICGTSTCYMCVANKPLFVEGVWGPYYSAMVPQMYLNEGGQSVSGKLIDFIIDNHSATPSIKEKLPSKMSIYEYLSSVLNSLAEKSNVENVDELTKDLHVWPDFHGNRSPLADPSLKGMICGLTLSSTEEDLAILYLAALQSLSYGARHILETLQDAGYEKFRALLVCGGLSKSPLFMQTLANCLQTPVLRQDSQDSVLLGAAMLGAYASGIYASVADAMSSMTGSAQVTLPKTVLKDYNQRKYNVFKKMVSDQKDYKLMMEGKTSNINGKSQ